MGRRDEISGGFGDHICNGCIKVPRVMSRLMRLQVEPPAEGELQTVVTDEVRQNCEDQFTELERIGLLVEFTALTDDALRSV
jgi:hypothetical protein